MFTGLIEEIGTLKSITTVSGSKRISVTAKTVLDDLKIDDSVAVNGVCLTVVSRTNYDFTTEAVEETIRKTTLGQFTAGRKINLERAMKLGGRLGGHLVQGHVDCTGRVQKIQSEGTGKLIWIEFPSEFSKYVVPLGSICIDGVSLTIAKKDINRFMVSVIPHTWETTTFKELKTGTELNLEFDIIGKYVESLTEPYTNNNRTKSGKSSLELFIDQPGM